MRHMLNGNFGAIDHVEIYVGLNVYESFNESTRPKNHFHTVFSVTG